MIESWIVFLTLAVGVRYLIGASLLMRLPRYAVSLLAAFFVRRVLWTFIPSARPNKRVSPSGIHYEERAWPLGESVDHVAAFVLDGVHSFLRCPACLGFWIGAVFYPMFPIGIDRKSTRLNSSHIQKSRMPSSA